MNNKLNVATVTCYGTLQMIVIFCTRRRIAFRSILYYSLPHFLWKSVHNLNEQCHVISWGKEWFFSDNLNLSYILPQDIPKSWLYPLLSFVIFQFKSILRPCPLSLQRILNLLLILIRSKNEMLRYFRVRVNISFGNRNVDKLLVWNNFRNTV